MLFDLLENCVFISKLLLSLPADHILNLVYFNPFTFNRVYQETTSGQLDYLPIVCLTYSLEAPRRDASNEYPQHVYVEK